MHMISFENDLLKPWSGGGGGPRPRSSSSVTFFVFNSTNSIISFILMEITNIIGQRRERTTLPCELPVIKDKIKSPGADCPSLWLTCLTAQQNNAVDRAPDRKESLWSSIVCCLSSTGYCVHPQDPLVRTLCVEKRWEEDHYEARTWLAWPHKTKEVIKCSFVALIGQTMGLLL